MNSVTLIGNLTRDPELKATQSGYVFCTFTVACTRRIKPKNGERETDFINCVAWRERGEFVHKYFHKGSKLAIEGTLQMRSYEAQDGTKRTAYEVLVDNVEFCERRQDGAKQYNAPPAPPDTFDDFVDVEESELPF